MRKSVSFARPGAVVLGLCVALAMMGPAWSAPKYEVTRWEVNGEYLELSVKQIEEEIFSYKLMDDDKRAYKMEFSKSLPAGTRFTVVDGWEIEANPRDVEVEMEVEKGKGKSLGDDREQYPKGSTILLKDKTEIVFRRLASAPEKSASKREAQAANVEELELDKRAESPKRAGKQTVKQQSEVAQTEQLDLVKEANYGIRWKLLSNGKKLTIEVVDRNGKLYKAYTSNRASGGDRCFIFNKENRRQLPKNTQFTVPEGWVIDCDRQAICLEGKSEEFTYGDHKGRKCAGV